MKTNRRSNEEESGSGKIHTEGNEEMERETDKEIEQNSDRHRDRVGKRELE